MVRGSCSWTEWILVRVRLGAAPSAFGAQDAIRSVRRKRRRLIGRLMSAVGASKLSKVELWHRFSHPMVLGEIAAFVGKSRMLRFGNRLFRRVEELYSSSRTRIWAFRRPRHGRFAKMIWLEFAPSSFVHARWDGHLWFGELLARNLEFRVGLITANAYISTLGGGYFLCRLINEAERMAHQQHAIALRLGDHSLASQCRVHLAYNTIQRGKLRLAKKQLLFEWYVAHWLKDERLKDIIRSAWHYAKRLKHFQRKLKEAPRPGQVDNFARQRFVETSKK